MILPGNYPLRLYPQWETHSLSEARDLCQQGSFPRVHSIDALYHRDDFHLRTASVQLNDVKLMCVNSSGHRISLIDDDRVGILVPLVNRIGVTDGGTDKSAGPGELLIPGLGLRTTTVSRDYTGLVVLLPHRYIEQQMVSEPSPDFAGLRRTQRPDTRRGAGRSLIDYLKFLVAQLDQGGTLAHSPQALCSAGALLIDHITALIARPGAGHKSDRSEAVIESWQLARARSFIEAHLSEPLTIAGIAAAIGTSTRSLQAAFQRYCAITPHEFLQQRRLDLLHHRLSHATPPAHVTSIAYECGFTHLSRCAQRYRQRFGESPHETLDRALRR